MDGVPDPFDPLVGVIRIVVTPTPELPTSAAWEAGELAEDSASAYARAVSLADECARDGWMHHIWVGHNGVYVPGLWKSYLHIAPPGWVDEITEQREAVVREWRQRVEEATARAKAAAALVRAERQKAREADTRRRTSTDAVLDVIG